MYERLLAQNLKPKTFFLWGQRQVGKSYLLKLTFPKAHYIDLLKSEEFFELSTRPQLLRERAEFWNPQDLIIIDEIQKVPQLLNEVHWLIENKKLKFGLSGSSARKLKRNHGNLLGGRAIRHELYGLSAFELKEDFDLKKMVNSGYLPNHYINQEDSVNLLKAYVSDYLKEEILAEGLIRNLPQFSRFLEVASIGDTEILNYSNIGRECGVSPKTVQNYYDILSDTLVGSFCPAFSLRPKRRTLMAPKFYFHDVGVVNTLSHRRNIQFRTETFGKAFENWVYHELKCYNQYFKKDQDLSYWRLTSGFEVDFIVGKLDIAIEVKGAERINDQNLKGLRELKKEYPSLKKRIIVCLEKQPRKTPDGIMILPYQKFITMLFEGELY